MQQRDRTNWEKTVDVSDVTRDQLRIVKETHTHPNAKIVADLKKRKLVKTQKIISYTIHKGAEFALEIAKLETDLTEEMIES